MPRTDRTAASNNVAGKSAGSAGATAPGSVTMVIDTPIRAISREVVRLMAQSLSANGSARISDAYLDFGVHLPESV